MVVPPEEGGSPVEYDWMDIRSRFWSKVQNRYPRFEYQSLQYQGFYPLMPLAEEAKYALRDATYSSQVSEDFHNKYFHLCGSYVATKPTRDRIEKSVMKMDRTPVYDYLDHPYFPLAEQMFAEGFDEVFRAPPLSPSVVVASMKMDTATGVVMRDLGIKKKNDFFLSPECVSKLYDPTLFETLPIWTVAPKYEKLPYSEYVSDLKIRTFIIEPVESVFWRKIYFGGQNEAIVDKWHSAYGFNPYQGGAHRYAQEFLKFRRFWMFDGKGWDRIASWMGVVWKHRTKYLNVENPRIKWLISSILNQVMLTPWGDILLRAYGNPSGSATTTGDNILGMTLVTLVCLLIAAKGDAALVKRSTWFRCFGDDNHGSDDLPCSDEELRQAFITGFGLFGIELDPLIVTHNFEELEFLGFKYFKHSSGFYIPKFPLDKLLTTFFYDLDVLDPFCSFQKLESTLLMSLAHGQEFYNDLRDEIILLGSYYKDPRIVKLIRELPSYSTTLSWYIGYESTNSGPLVNFSRRLWRMEEQNFVMEEPKFVKAEKKIKLLSEKVGVSADGQEWIKQCLDPFCDMPRRTVGEPDVITAGSVIQVVKKSMTVDVTGNEDIHVILDTIDTPTMVIEQADYNEAGVYRPNNYQIDTVPGATYRRGGLLVRRASTGALTLPTQQTSGYQLALDTSYASNGSCRVIAKGFEVHNTTNKLNVGGSVVVYRNTATSVEQRPSGVAVLRNNTTPTTIANTMPATKLANPPMSAAEAFRIPGAQQWEAKDGCYVVAVRSSQVNDPVEDESCIIHYKDSGNSTANRSWVNSGAGGNVPTIFPSNVDGQPTFPMIISPFFQCGAYFTGLPAGSKLTINVMWIIERFVNAQNADLVLLTNPSPNYDPVAMEVYSRTAAKMPHGTKVKNNADGDWIKTIADVLGGFGVPGMPLVKGAVDLWNNYQSSNKPDPRPNIGVPPGLSKKNASMMWDIANAANKSWAPQYRNRPTIEAGKAASKPAKGKQKKKRNRKKKSQIKKY